jgi:UDP-N-acetylglucosamine:LPS N-acetylglucosamine transferase
MGTVIYILQAIPTLIVMGSSTGWRDLAKLLPDIMKRETLNAARADALDRLKP